MLNNKNKILIFLAIIIIMAMIISFGLLYFWTGKDNNKENLNIKPKTIVPENTVGEPYVEQPGTGTATTESPAQSYDIPPSALPEAPTPPK